MRSKKLLILPLMVLLICSPLFGCGGNSSPATNSGNNTTPSTSTGSSSGASNDTEYEKLTIKLSMASSEQGIEYKTSVYFKELVEEASGGQIKIELYPNYILSGGNMAEAINLLTMGGSYEMAFCSAAVLGNLDPVLQVNMLPFLFEDYSSVDAMLDGSGNDFYTEKLDEYGLVNLGTIYAGLKQWTSSKIQLLEPANFNNFKIRIPGGEVTAYYFRQLGADPVAMSYSEVFTSLQQGTIDGHENSYYSIYGANLHEVQKYITEVNYQFDGFWLLVNKNDWSKWPEATKELVSEKAREAILYGRSRHVEDETRMRQEMLDSGVIITTLTPEQRQPFIDVAKSCYDYFLDVYGEKAYEAWGVEY